MKQGSRDRRPIRVTENRCIKNILQQIVSVYLLYTIVKKTQYNISKNGKILIISKKYSQTGRIIKVRDVLMNFNAAEKDKCRKE